MRILVWGTLFLVGWPCVAADCLQFKKIPGVYINTPDWSKTVVQPHEQMNLWHGNVVATLVDNYQINGGLA